MPSLSRATTRFLSTAPPLPTVLGIHWASTIPAFLALACVPFPFLFYRYGPKIRVNCKYSQQADAFMRIWNADGGQVEACGNGVRCVAAFLMTESGASETVVETVAGLLSADRVRRLIQQVLGDEG